MREVVLIVLTMLFIMLGCSRDSDDIDVEGDTAKGNDSIESSHVGDAGSATGQPQNGEATADNGDSTDSSSTVSDDNRPTDVGRSNGGQSSGDQNDVDQNDVDNAENGDAAEADQASESDSGDPGDGEPIDSDEPENDSEETSSDQTDKTGVPPEPTPAAGERLAICDSDADCQIKSDDLVCFGASNNTLGFCTEDCIEDSNCSEIGGFSAVCSQNGMCTVPCENEEDVSCPKNMGCVRIIEMRTVPLNRRGIGHFCTYTEDTIQPTKKALEKCDYSFECPDDLECYHPGVLGNNPVGNGFCISSCNSDEDCQAYQQDGVEVACGNLGYCDFKCVSDADCPNSMICRGIDGLRWEDEVCWYL